MPPQIYERCTRIIERTALFQKFPVQEIILYPDTFQIPSLGYCYVNNERPDCVGALVRNEYQFSFGRLLELKCLN